MVTGGAGFIGSHLVDRLVNEGYRIDVFDDLSGGSTKNLLPEDYPYKSFFRKDVEFYKLDLRMNNLYHLDAKRKIDSTHYDLAFLLAANAAENKAQFSPIDITSRNYDAFIKTLVPLIKNKVGRVVFTSSIAVYGKGQTPFKETDKPEPEDLYGITKLAIEQTLKVMSEVHNFEYVIARPHNVYGPRQNMRDPYRNVVTNWMNSILRNEPYYIYGDGEQKRCFSYIDDVVDALYKCGVEDVSGKTFNIGADKAYSLNELMLALKPPYKAKYLPQRSQEVQEAIADHSEAKKHLNYRDLTPLSVGLEKTWKYAKKQGPQEPIKTELELVNDKVPKNWL